MQSSRIANTDISVSRLGLGTVKFGRTEGVKYPNAFTLPTNQEIIHLLRLSKELGINLLDTAPAYGSSETRLGEILEGNRHEWIISTKVGEEFSDGQSDFFFQPKDIIKSIERSLKRLKTDYIDIVFVHSNGDDVKIIQEMDVFGTLFHLKQLGKIRAFGMSTKTIEGGMLTIEKSDIAMVTYNLEYQAEKAVIESAKQKQKSIFIKKAFISGHLDKVKYDDPIKQTFKSLFKTEGVTSVILGTLNPNHLKENVEKALPFL